MNVIRTVVYLSLSLVGIITFAHCQSARDSLLLQLYKNGQISKRTYYASIPKDSLIALNIRQIQKLQRELKYKFVLDFLLNYKTEEGESLVDPANPYLDPDDIRRKTDTAEKSALEQFVIDFDYSLREIKSFTGSERYYLLASSERHHLYRLWLLGDDTSHWIFGDTYEFPREIGRFDFDTLNGHNVIRTSKTNWSTGHYAEDEAILGVIDNRFKPLFVT
jgi:hypothetical protein